MILQSSVKVSYIRSEGEASYETTPAPQYPFTDVVSVKINGYIESQFRGRFVYERSSINRSSLKQDPFPFETVRAITDIAFLKGNNNRLNHPNPNLRFLWGDLNSRLVTRIAVGSAFRPYVEMLINEQEAKEAKSRLGLLESSRDRDLFQEKIEELKQTLQRLEARPIQFIVSSLPTALLHMGLLTYAYPVLKHQEERYEMVYNSELGFFEPSQI